MTFLKLANEKLLRAARGHGLVSQYQDTNMFCVLCPFFVFSFFVFILIFNMCTFIIEDYYYY